MVRELADIKEMVKELYRTNRGVEKTFILAKLPFKNVEDFDDLETRRLDRGNKAELVGNIYYNIC